MKRFAIVPSFVAVLALNTGCIKPTPRSVIKTGLDIAQIACIIINDNLDDEHALAKACDISDDYLDVIRELVLGRNKAKAMKAAAASSASASVHAPVTPPPAPVKK